MIYTMDCEFWEHGHMSPLRLISIGIVAEDGREYYAVNQDFPWTLLERTAPKHWIFENVKPKLYLPDQSEKKNLKTLAHIRQDLISFFSKDKQPEFWAYFADYDWVIFCQIFGTMIDLPKGFPMMCMDIEQKRKMLSLVKEIYPPKYEDIHNALSDAHWDMEALNKLLLIESKIPYFLGALR